MNIYSISLHMVDIAEAYSHGRNDVDAATGVWYYNLLL
jgi:phosphate/sulfate permease